MRSMQKLKCLLRGRSLRGLIVTVTLRRFKTPVCFTVNLVAHIQLIADGQQRYCSVKIKYEVPSRQSV